MASSPLRRERRRSHVDARRRRRLIMLVSACVLVAGIVAIAVTIALGHGRGSLTATVEASATPPPSPTPTATPPPTPSRALLATTDDPDACAVTFAGDGISDAPTLQTQGTLHTDLPIPASEGRVFAGWYATTDGAAALAIHDRVNGSKLVTCAERESTLHGAWTTPDDNAAESARIPILMYHQFTDRPEGEDHWLRLNYAYVGDFDAHVGHISGTGFYLPTWDELDAFIDGRLFLPDHSVIITDDDADQTWFDLAVPVIEKHEVLATSFMVTAHRQDPAPSPYVLRRSHTHDMHRAGADGRGMMVNATADEIAADLQTSAEVLGVKEVLAYPFGHHDETAKQGVAQAGFALARTIEHGYVTIGTDKLAMPTIRVDYGMGLDALMHLIG